MHKLMHGIKTVQWKQKVLGVGSSVESLSLRSSENGVYCPFGHRYRPRLDSPLTGDRGQDDWSLEALVWVDLWVVPVLGGGSRGPGGRTDVMERARGWTRAPWPGQWHFPLPVLNSDQWTHCLRHSCHSTAFPSIKGCCFCSQWRACHMCAA